MKNDKLREYVIREEVMKLLSVEEIARVTTPEAGPRLADGEEYLDLEDTAHGARRAGGANVPLGRVLPKSAVQAATWTKILAMVGDASVRAGSR